MNSATVTVGIPTYNRAALLRDTIESVLAQTYREFRLIISDNASTDETPQILASYRDPRIDYIRGERNIGMIGNFNRVISRAETEFLIILPDDDLLYPEYLRAVMELFDRYPRVGVVHTAFDEIDIDSRVQKHGTSFVKSSHRWKVVEPGLAFLERSMTSTALCQSSATFRTRAILEAGGLKEQDEPFADVPLFMRIAQHWDLAYLDQPLIAFRVHDQTETSQLASLDHSEPAARDRLLTYGQIMFDRRIGFLDGAELPTPTTTRLRALATLRFLAERAGLDSPWLQTWAGFVRIVRIYPRILSNPIAWRLVAAQLGGRRLRRAIDGLRRDGMVFGGIRKLPDR